MNKIFLLLIMLVSAMSSFALPIDIKTAAKRASYILNKEVTADEALSNSVRRRISPLSVSPAFYVFNAEDGQGFVILSAESQMPEVVGYSYTNSFDSENMPSSLQHYLNNYTNMVDMVRCGDAYAPEAKSMTRAATPVVGPLCECQWGQNAPYNTLCPIVNGKDCPVGCVATALAQIMFHFKWPVRGEGQMIYATGITGYTPLVSVFSDHEYAWADMMNTTKENKALASASEAVAQLSFDCGVASKMSYAPDGSGTHDNLAMAALYTYFGYKASSIHIEYRDCFSTQDEWNALVKSELDNNRPVLYGGYDPSGGAGHEFIIDGYDTQDFFHVNWGWDGGSDGFYSIVTLQPKSTNVKFSEGQSMVCGIEPDVDGTDKIPHQFRVYLIDSPSVSNNTVNLGESFIFNTNTFYNYSRIARTWTIGVGLYDESGKQLDILSSKTSAKYKQQVLSYYSVRNMAITATFPEDLADGSYYLRLVTCQKDYEEFILPDMVGGTELNKIPVVVENGVVSFLKIPTSVNTISYDAPVLNTEYYTLDGKKANSSDKGILIRRDRKADGSVNNIKMYNK